MTPEELAAIKAQWQSDRSAKHVPALVAEVERLRRVEAAAKAYIDAHDAIYACRVIGAQSSDIYQRFSDMWVARDALFAALRAAGSGE